MSHPITLETLAGKLDELLSLKRRESARYLDVVGSADYCSLSPESIRRLLSSGKLTALRPVKGKICIDRTELDALILSSNQRPRRGRGMR